VSSSDVSSAHVTASRIEMVRLGMTQQEVEAIHLDRRRVAEVYAKQYILWGFDDRGIYLLSAEQPAPSGQGLAEVLGD
jgi:hypothetical protein